jgi:hypothetical protein
MTPRQMQTLRQWWPFVTIVFTAGILYATLRGDVANSVRTPRFEAESLRTKIRFENLERQQKTLDAICRAVRCK